MFSDSIFGYQEEIDRAKDCGTNENKFLNLAALKCNLKDIIFEDEFM